ncbi:ABC transporter ATP-binding protein/permease [Shimazuella sp. AN120528]|uniref:ABC transporter ATP-binding protein n=1 Tax=Shimazuella soli TaxID=1892854 RepID=UPI001F0CFCEF|nr:ABC transporter ATP-binding protein [Shimazuella soli]MCH5584505.1 ABC transporter ATP-binding protein/permease [Shimazuella soli]
MGSIRALGKFLKPYRGIAILGPLLMVLEVTMDLLQPTIMQHIIDHGIANQDTGYVIRMGILMIVAALIGLVGGLGCIFFSTKTAVNFSGDVRLAALSKIITFSGENRERFGAGKLITIVTNDIVTIQNALTMTLRVLVRGPLLFIGSMVIVLFSSKGLSPVLFVVVPALLITVFFIANRSSRMFQKVQEAIDKVNTRLQENLAGMRVIKAYVQQKQEIQRFAEVNDGLTKANRSAVQVISIMMPVIMLIINGGIIGTLWLGTYKVADNSIEVGAILAFINYLMLILMALMQVSMVSILITRAVPSAARVQEVLDTKITITNKSDSYEPSEIKGKVEFQNVSFSYSKNEEQVLKNISFSVQSGETIGIIGSTGSGKSTLVKLIARLYDVDSGEILLDGINIKQYKLDALRSSIGFVTQKATLFSGSILENIRYGNDEVGPSELKAAADDACASEFIDRLEDGYKYTLTQGATNLSGGQKQRLSLARAFVRSAPILILDDSTSAVDAKSEETIQAALHRSSDQTIFLIASKISSLMDADKILVLEDGELVGMGSHTNLLADCEVYREIYLSQGGQIDIVAEAGGKS